MANKDHYDYPEDTQDTDQTYGMGTKQGRTETVSSQLAMLKDPKVLGTLVGFMLFSYLVSHLLSFLIGGNATPEPQKVDKPPVVQKRTAAKSLAVQLKAQQEKDQAHQNVIQEKMKSFQNQSANNVQEIQKVMSKVHHLEDVMAELTNNIGDLHYEISLLSDQMKAMKVKKPKIVVKKTPKKLTPKKIVPKIQKHYAVKALIHGRAWLSSPSHPYLTVQVGDAVPTYGVVTAILPDIGLVKTSSGRTITFEKTNG